jgi:DNA topoisomerase VI subunit A
VGHWHVWDFHQNLGEDRNSTSRDIYYSNHLIALDGGVVSNGWELTSHPNVLVIDDSDFSICTDQNGSKLTNMEVLNHDR